MKRDRALQPMGDLSKIVDPVTMIGMVMSDYDMIDGISIGPQQLFAHVRPAVDQQALSIAVDQD